MSKQHVMLDLETMGTGPTAAITAIGAVAFSVEAGITDTFYKKVDLESSVRNGGTMDPGTVIWWLGQSDAARKEMAALRKSAKAPDPAACAAEAELIAASPYN